MSSFYNSLASTALSLLKQFGKSLTLTQYGLATVDVTSGVASRPVVSTSTEYGAMFDFDYRSFGASLGVPSDVGKISKRLLMTSKLDVGPGDTILFDNVLYAVKVAKVVNPAGTRVVYDLWIQA
jgi:hypothetical protein